jgi:hypothetical protein
LDFKIEPNRLYEELVEELETHTAGPGGPPEGGPPVRARCARVIPTSSAPPARRRGRCRDDVHRRGVRDWILAGDMQDDPDRVASCLARRLVRRTDRGTAVRSGLRAAEEEPGIGLVVDAEVSRARPFT